MMSKHNYHRGTVDNGIVYSDSYVKSIYTYISDIYIDMSLYLSGERSLNDFLNDIDYPHDRNVNHDMIIYYVRDNLDLVKFKLL